MEAFRDLLGEFSKIEPLLGAGEPSSVLLLVIPIVRSYLEHKGTLGIIVRRKCARKARLLSLK